MAAAGRSSQSPLRVKSPPAIKVLGMSCCVGCGMEQGWGWGCCATLLTAWSLLASQDLTQLLSQAGIILSVEEEVKIRHNVCSRGAPWAKAELGKVCPLWDPSCPPLWDPSNLQESWQGRAGQHRGWVQQWCKPWPGEIPAKQKPGVLGHGKTSPAARDVSDHSEQDHPPPPPPPRGSVLVVVKPQPCPAKPMGLVSHPRQGQLRFCHAGMLLHLLPGPGECWLSLSHPQPPWGACPQEQSQGLPSVTPLQSLQHIRDAERILLTFRDHSLGVTPSLLP